MTEKNEVILAECLKT